MQSEGGLREIQFICKHDDIPVQPKLNSRIHKTFLWGQAFLLRDV